MQRKVDCSHVYNSHSFDVIGEAYAHAETQEEREHLERENERLKAELAERALARGDMQTYERAIGRRHQAWIGSGRVS